MTEVMDGSPDIWTTIWDSKELLLAVLAVFITAALLLWLKQRKQKGKAVLLVGLSGSGKTLIFSQFVHRRGLLTVTSVKENVGNLDLGNKKTLKIVDIPGQERVRQKFFDAWKASAKGVVFVIDSVSFNKDIRDITDYLYNLLVDPTIASTCPSVLIFCNKQDLAAAKGQQLLKTTLEKEMNLLRENRSKLLDSSGASNNNTFLGKRGKDFKFSDLKPIRISFAEGYATNKTISSNHEDEVTYDLESLSQFVSKLRV